MRVYEGSTIERLLTPGLAREAIAEAYARIASGELQGPVRSGFGQGDETSLVMPATSQDFVGLKILHLRPANVALGRPAIVGEMLLYDRASGELLAVFEGAALTGVRTAALAGHATRLLAPQGATVATVLGAGYQAAYQARALVEACGVEEIRIWNRTPNRAARLVDRLAEELDGVRLAACDERTAALRGAAVATAVTASRTSLISRDMLAPQVHINLMGSHTPEMCELEPAVFAGASAVYADVVEACRVEAGDLLQAEQAGALRWERVRTMGDVVPRSGITVFKSVGAAVFDLCCAEALWRADGAA